MMDCTTWDCEKEILGDMAAEAQGDVCEIGAWAGKTTKVLIESMPAPRRLVVIDPWDWEGQVFPKFACQFQEAKQEFDRMLIDLPHEQRNRIEVIQKTSFEAASLLEGRQFGMVFVDGNHETDACLADLIQYWPMLRGMPNFMVVHDVFDDHWGQKLIKSLWAFSRHLEDIGEQCVISFHMPRPLLAERNQRGVDEMGGLAVLSRLSYGPLA